MFKSPRWVRATVIAVAASLTLTACWGSEESEGAQTSHDENLGSLSNDLEGRNYSKKHPLKADDLTVVTTYSTSYNVKDWQITSNKTLNIELAVVPGASAAGTQVLVEHMHADVSLLGNNEQLNGWPQDSMDSSIHGGQQPGFEVSQKHPFSMVFSIEGMSDTLISGWGFATGEFGAMEIEEKRLTEDTLRKNGGIIGNKIIVVWVVLIKGANDQNYHEVSLYDEFRVPVG